MATITCGKLTNANVSTDENGVVWLWIAADGEHVGMNLSSKLPDPNFQEKLKQWVRQQEQRTNDVPNS